MAAVVFGVITWRTHNPGRGFVALAAWISFYQILFDRTQVLLGQHRVTQLAAAGGLLGWVILAFVLGHRPSLPGLVIFGLGWAVWIAAGFHANVHNLPPYSAFDELINVLTKTALGLDYACGELAPSSGRGLHA